jgi:hypothetical protein
VIIKDNVGFEPVLLGNPKTLFSDQVQESRKIYNPLPKEANTCRCSTAPHRAVARDPFLVDRPSSAGRNLP